jgi:hypothetical protein
MIITIDGVAGAGKTTLADFIRDEYSDRLSVQVIHMDDLYDGWVDPFGAALAGKLHDICTSHQEGKGLVTSKFDWQRASPGELLEIDPVDLLIIEGVGSGQRTTRQFAQTKIWIDLEPILGMRRVLARDGYQIETQMLTFLEHQQIHHLEEGTRAAADFHVNGLG